MQDRKILLNKDYLIVPKNAIVLYVSTENTFSFTVTYTPKPRIKKVKELFKAEHYPEKGLKAQGIRLAEREALAIEIT